MYTYKTGLSTSEHDRFVIDSPQTNLLQSSSWAKIKDSWGNDRLGFYQDGNLVAVASVLIQPLPLGFSMIYIPRGPIMDYQDKELLAFVMASLKKYAKTKRALFVKFDPSLFVTKNLISQEAEIREETMAIAKDIQALGVEWTGLTEDMAENIQPRFQANSIRKISLRNNSLRVPSRLFVLLETRGFQSNLVALSFLNNSHL